VKLPPEGTEAKFRHDREMHRAKGVAEIIIGKNRHGPETTVILGFDANLTRFNNEPEPREEFTTEMDLKQARPKKITLPKEATVCLGILRNLNITHAVENKDLEKVPHSVRPVPYLTWRDKCAEALLHPGFEEKDAIALMKKVHAPLMEAGLIGRGGSKDTPFAWLTDKGVK